MGDISFGICIGAVDVAGTSDEALYQCVNDDIDFAARLGYDGVWTLEHHFSNYYPTPSPLIVLANAAGRCPDLELGAMVVVAPWHQPMRLAEEIAMLSLMTRASIHLGLGRGSGALEYEGFGMDLDQSRDRFREVIEIVQRALAGGAFTYEGRYHQVPHPLEIRPHPRRDRINLYGAISSPPTAQIMAELGLPMFCNAVRPLEMHRQVLETWARVTAERGRDPGGVKLLQAHLVVADSDAEADRLVRATIPQFFAAQVDHYAADLDRYDRIKSFDMRKMHADRMRLSDPKNLDGFIDLQLVGTPQTVRRKLQRYIDIGFNKFVVTTNTPGIPASLRHQWLERFAREVGPEFSGKLARAASRQKSAAAQ
jgi:alkanesulfonate monooxygenase SsuD/methylene tetrahydromethanopterin reductase-like flavin-dependent oxidoreductase (luciferase family)